MTTLGLVVAYLLAVNLATFAVFAWDKRCARKKTWRVSEATLLNLALIGGSPGAKYAQKKLRHKSYKQPFGQRLNATISFQMVALGVIAVLWISPELRNSLFAQIAH